MNDLDHELDIDVEKDDEYNAEDGRSYTTLLSPTSCTWFFLSQTYSDVHIKLVQDSQKIYQILWNWYIYEILNINI